MPFRNKLISLDSYGNDKVEKNVNLIKTRWNNNEKMIDSLGQQRPIIRIKEPLTIANSNFSTSRLELKTRNASRNDILRTPFVERDNYFHGFPIGILSDRSAQNDPNSFILKKLPTIKQPSVAINRHKDKYAADFEDKEIIENILNLFKTLSNNSRGAIIDKVIREYKESERKSSAIINNKFEAPKVLAKSKSNIVNNELDKMEIPFKENRQNEFNSPVNRFYENPPLPQCEVQCNCKRPSLGECIQLYPILHLDTDNYRSFRDDFRFINDQQRMEQRLPSKNLEKQFEEMMNRFLECRCPNNFMFYTMVSTLMYICVIIGCFVGFIIMFNKFAR